jgi:hypothetical protein
MGYRYIQRFEVSADPVGGLAAPDLPRTIPVAEDGEARRNAGSSVHDFLDSMIRYRFCRLKTLEVSQPDMEYLSDGQNCQKSARSIGQVGCRIDLMTH